MRYYYVKDLIDRKIITLEYCVSEKIIADTFTKPLQGNRYIILNQSQPLNTSDPALQYRSVFENSTNNYIVKTGSINHANEHMYDDETRIESVSEKRDQVSEKT
jgi:hypothetical protein